MINDLLQRDGYKWRLKTTAICDLCLFGQRNLNFGEGTVRKF